MDFKHKYTVVEFTGEPRSVILIRSMLKNTTYSATMKAGVLFLKSSDLICYSNDNQIRVKVGCYVSVYEDSSDVYTDSSEFYVFRWTNRSAYKFIEKYKNSNTIFVKLLE